MTPGQLPPAPMLGSGWGIWCLHCVALSCLLDHSSLQIPVMTKIFSLRLEATPILQRSSVLAELHKQATQTLCDTPAHILTGLLTLSPGAGEETHTFLLPPGPSAPAESVLSRGSRKVCVSSHSPGPALPCVLWA